MDQQMNLPTAFRVVALLTIAQWLLVWALW